MEARAQSRSQSRSSLVQAGANTAGLQKTVSRPGSRPISTPGSRVGQTQSNYADFEATLMERTTAAATQVFDNEEAAQRRAMGSRLGEERFRANAKPAPAQQLDKSHPVYDGADQDLSGKARNTADTFANTGVGIGDWKERSMQPTNMPNRATLPLMANWSADRAPNDEYPLYGFQPKYMNL